MSENYYDAVVVGSGATGGVAAMELTRVGLKVLVLEAGEAFTGQPYGGPISNLAKVLAQRWVTKKQFTQESHPAYWATNPDLFINDKDNPYTTPEGRPYRWIRGRQLGGRSHTWGGCTLRLSDFEFKAATYDGIGSDWPISVRDLDPYYDKLEGFFKVYGNRDGLAQLPDGNFLTGSTFSPDELVLKKTIKRNFNRDLIISRGIRAVKSVEGTEQYSRLSSPATSLARAAATRNLTIETNAIACRLVRAKSKSAVSGVEYIDAKTCKTHIVNGKVIFLCASTIESIRILMLSKLGNQSGLLGKGLMDNIVCNLFFHMPETTHVKGYSLTGCDSVLIPRYQNLPGREASFRRGFGMWGGIHRSAFGSAVRKRPKIALGFLCCMGETLPDDANHMDLDPAVRDAWGIPVPRIDCKWSANDFVLAQAMRGDAEDTIHAIRGEITALPDVVWTPMLTGFMRKMGKDWEVTTPGQFVHEVGGARMGAHPEVSVVNSFGQLWECPNVFVTDGSCWTSSSWQNPTLTEMAITARAAERAVIELKAGNL